MVPNDGFIVSCWTLTKDILLWWYKWMFFFSLHWHVISMSREIWWKQTQSTLEYFCMNRENKKTIHHCVPQSLLGIWNSAYNIVVLDSRLRTYERFSISQWRKWTLYFERNCSLLTKLRQVNWSKHCVCTSIGQIRHNVLATINCVLISLSRRIGCIKMLNIKFASHISKFYIPLYQP